ncbi:hypothetical protein ACROYT_G004929 [Oculina patagonica]
MLSGQHNKMALLKALGDFSDGSNWMSALVQAEIATVGTSNSFLKAVHVKETALAHQIIACALYRLQQASYFEWPECSGTSFEESCEQRALQSPQFNFWQLNVLNNDHKIQVEDECIDQHASLSEDSDREDVDVAPSRGQGRGRGSSPLGLAIGARGGKKCARGKTLGIYDVYVFNRSTFETTWATRWPPMEVTVISKRSYLENQWSNYVDYSKEKGLSTVGKKKVLIQRLVNAYYESKTAVKSELSESHEDLNFAKLSKEVPSSVSKEQSKEITSIRRKAKVLQGDTEVLICDISELSESEGNKVKMQITIERLTEFRMAYLQLRDGIISLLSDKEIDDELSCWRELLDMTDRAVDAGHEYLYKESNLNEQSSKGSVQKGQLPII